MSGSPKPLLANPNYSSVKDSETLKAYQDYCSKNVEGFDLNRVRVANRYDGMQDGGKFQLLYRHGDGDRFCDAQIHWTTGEMEIRTGSHQKQEIWDKQFVRLKDVPKVTEALVGPEEITDAEGKKLINQKNGYLDARLAGKEGKHRALNDFLKKANQLFQEHLKKNEGDLTQKITLKDIRIENAIAEDGQYSFVYVSHENNFFVEGGVDTNMHALALRSGTIEEMDKAEFKGQTIAYYGCTMTKDLVGKDEVWGQCHDATPREVSNYEDMTLAFALFMSSDIMWTGMSGGKALTARGVRMFVKSAASKELAARLTARGLTGEAFKQAHKVGLARFMRSWNYGAFRWIKTRWFPMNTALAKGIKWTFKSPFRLIGWGFRHAFNPTKIPQAFMRSVAALRAFPKQIPTKVVQGYQAARAWWNFSTARQAAVQTAAAKAAAKRAAAAAIAGRAAGTTAAVRLFSLRGAGVVAGRLLGGLGILWGIEWVAGLFTSDYEESVEKRVGDRFREEEKVFESPSGFWGWVKSPISGWRMISHLLFEDLNNKAVTHAGLWNDTGKRIQREVLEEDRKSSEQSEELIANIFPTALEENAALTTELMSQAIRFDFEGKMESALAKAGVTEAFASAFHLPGARAENKVKELQAKLKLRHELEEKISSMDNRHWFWKGTAHNVARYYLANQLAATNLEEDMESLIRQQLTMTDEKAREAADKAANDVFEKADEYFTEEEIEQKATEAAMKVYKEIWDQSNQAVSLALGIDLKEVERLQFKVMLLQVQRSAENLVFIDQDMNDWAREVFNKNGSLKDGDASLEKLKQRFFLSPAPAADSATPPEKTGILDKKYQQGYDPNLAMG